MGIINFWEKYYMNDLVVGNENPQKNIGRTKSGSPITDEAWKQSIQYIKSEIGLKITDDILEVCCGNGMVIGELSKYCNSAKGIDFSENFFFIVNVTSPFQSFRISESFPLIFSPFTFVITSSGAIPFLSVTEFGSTFLIITFPFSLTAIKPAKT